jgi:poly-gamma-glutamate capsule biosynthesis protein CapA/YwtB (metallophosphatase superfamily)
MKAKIIVGGDFCITPSHVSENLFSKELTEFFSDSDLNIVNLECPVINENDNLKSKITKIGPHLYTNEKVFNQLHKINIHSVTLANNHILDLGEKGLKTTLEGCKKNNLMVIGAGENLSEASKPVFIESNGLRIGLINFCESEWSIARENNAGANPLDVIDNLNQIKIARETADFVLVIVHGGHELYHLPSPRMIKTYRFFAEQGVDAVIGHHTHCVSGYEIYKNVPIFYSLGNMIFTLPVKQENWYIGLLLQLNLEKGKKLQFELHPIQQSQHNYKLTILKNAQKEKVLDEVEDYSKTISNESELKNQWDMFIKRKKSTLNVFSPLNVIPGAYLRAVLRRLGFNKILMGTNYLAQILNHVQCEAHRDVVTTLLQEKITKK